MLSEKYSIILVLLNDLRINNQYLDGQTQSGRLNYTDSFYKFNSQALCYELCSISFLLRDANRGTPTYFKIYVCKQQFVNHNI